MGAVLCHVLLQPIPRTTRQYQFPRNSSSKQTMCHSNKTPYLQQPKAWMDEIPDHVHWSQRCPNAGILSTQMAFYQYNIQILFEDANLRTPLTLGLKYECTHIHTHMTCAARFQSKGVVPSALHWCQRLW